jgi:type II secretory pathway component PulM
MSRLLELWNNLSDRDRRALTVLGPAILLYVIVQLFVSMSNQIEQVNRTNNVLVQQISEMRAMIGQVTSPNQARSRNALSTLINQLGQRSAVTYESIQPNNGGTRVVMKDISQRALWRWLALGQGEGLRLTTLTITANDDGTVDAVATVNL